ncbi:hypothetical protein BH23CHL5_BH23CHL5_02580 [soil metagenome]
MPAPRLPTVRESVRTRTIVSLVSIVITRPPNSSSEQENKWLDCPTIRCEMATVRWTQCKSDYLSVIGVPSGG